MPKPLSNEKRFRRRKNTPRGRRKIDRWPSFTRLMKAAGYTEEELAQKMGVTVQTISDWRLGRTAPPRNRLMELTTLLNDTNGELLADAPQVESRVKVCVFNAESEVVT